MGKKDSKHSNSEADALFRAAVGDAQPLKVRGRHPNTPTVSRREYTQQRNKAEVFVAAASEQASQPDSGAGEALFFQRASVSRQTMRDLRRGKIRRQAEIDLHGMTGTAARAELREFINDCCRRQLRCVRVIHGKGHGSGARGPVLKSGVNNWLREWAQVCAFCSAGPAEGGTGALYVLLTSA